MQRELRHRVLDEVPTRAIELVAGADISFDKHSETIYAAIIVLRLPSMEVVEEQGIVTTTQFPYVPGLLSFRE